MRNFITSLFKLKPKDERALDSNMADDKDNKKAPASGNQALKKPGNGMWIVIIEGDS